MITYKNILFIKYAQNQRIFKLHVSIKLVNDNAETCTVSCCDIMLTMNNWWSHYRHLP